MCRFIETIRIDHTGIRNIRHHNLRFNQTRKRFFGIEEETDLSKYIGKIPKIYGNEILRCRIEYSKQIEKIDLIPYQKKEIRSLKMVYDDSVDYSFKYANREALLSLLRLKQNCDEIIIVKNGYISDSSYANLVFYDGKDYFTPSTPLLKGTKRSLLLENKLLKEIAIFPDKINTFKHIGFINAMLDLNDYQIDIKNIVF